MDRHADGRPDRARELTADRLGMLLRFARALTGDRALAEDIVQEVALRLLTRRGEAPADIDAYARRMIVNEYASWHRKWGRQRPVAAVEQWPADEAAPDPSERHATLRDLEQRLATLSRKQRSAIVLRYFADQSDEQIAETMGCSRNAVRSLVSRGLAALRLQNAAEQPTVGVRGA